MAKPSLLAIPGNTVRNLRVFATNHRHFGGSWNTRKRARTRLRNFSHYKSS